MKENILSLIEHDINISRFLHFTRLYLQADIDKLNTNNSDVILGLMRIKSSDEVHERYFQLIDSAHDILENEELDKHLDNVFMFLTSLQVNPETRLDDSTPVQLGMVKISYTF